MFKEINERRNIHINIEPQRNGQINANDVA